MKVTGGAAGRVLLWMGFAIRSLLLITEPMGEAGHSVLHLMNLPFHEAATSSSHRSGITSHVIGATVMVTARVWAAAAIRRARLTTEAD
jgi:hypothetical protein